MGGFKNIVHNNDLTKAISIRFDLEFQPGEWNIPIHGPKGEFEDTDEWLDPPLIADKVWVKTSIKWSDVLNKPIIDTYEVGFDNDLLAIITHAHPSHKSLPSSYLSFFNFKNSIFYSTCSYHTIDDSFPEKEEFRREEDGWFWVVCDTITKKKLKDSNINLALHSQNTVIPNWKEELRFYRDELFKRRKGVSYDEYEENSIVALLSTMIAGPGQVIRDTLRKFRYIGPLRELPARDHTAPLTPDESRWASGIAAWDILIESDDNFINKTNEWLNDKNHLDTGYVVEVKRFKEFELKSNFVDTLMEEKMTDWRKAAKELIDKLPSANRIYLHDPKKEILVKPQDVGIGISQVLPVIVGTIDLESGIMAIEQPELHLHPAFQIALGDLFISQINDNDKDVIFLLETHSEHLMLRFLRRIRETNENELFDEKYKLSPKQLVVYFTETDKDGMRLTPIRVDRDGEFIDQWPKGFFEEREDELLY